MGLTSDNKLIASKGTLLVNVTTVVTADFSALVVVEDCVFTSIKLGATDTKDAFISSSSATIKAGTYISFGATARNSIQLTSGVVNLVLA